MRVGLVALEAAGPAHRPGLIVRVADEAGHAGVGDAAPLPGRTADDLDAARAALGAVRAGGDLVVAPSVDGVAAALRGLAAAGLDPARVPSATFALETALLDLVGRRLGRPLWALLRDPGAPPPVPVGVNALAADPGAAGAAAEAARAAGFPALKVKVASATLAEVRAGLAAARAAGGPDLALRLDAGGAWAVAEAPGHLAALAGLGLAYVEDPVAPEDLPALARAEVPAAPLPAVPLAADAPLERPGGLEAVVAAGIVSVAILKPAFLGGVLPARRLARRARAAGLAVVLTHALDGPAGLAAAADLALALDPGPLASGLTAHPDLAAWPGLRPTRVRGPVVIPGGAPGLGLEA